MHRRGFLGLLAAVVGLRVRLKADTTPELFGYLTPEIVIARGYDNSSARVFLNGVDVTSLPKPFGTVLSCDDRAGWIEVIARDSSGNYRRDPQNPDRLARERRYGNVRVTLQRPGAAA